MNKENSSCCGGNDKENSSCCGNKDKKYPCPDCYSCQFCSDTRCRVCLAQQKKKGKKQLSVADQIALYNKLNSEDDP